MFQSDEQKEQNGLVKRDRVAMEARVRQVFQADPVANGFSSGYRWLDWTAGCDDADVAQGRGILFPRSCITELAGLQQAGKTTLAMEAVAFNQHLYRAKFGRPLRVLWVDWEHSLTKQRRLAEALGMLFDDHFTYVQPLTLEGGGQFIVERCRGVMTALDKERQKKAKKKDGNAYESVIPDMIVVDTLAAARPSIEYSNKLGQTKQPAIRGKLWAEFFRNIMPELPGEEGPAVIMINHLTVQLNLDNQRGPAMETAGSNLLRFYAMARYFLRSIKTLREDITNPFTYETMATPVAGITEMEAHKAKIGPSYRRCTYTNLFGTGITPVPTLVAAALAKGEKTGKHLVHVYGKGDWYDVLKEPTERKAGKEVPKAKLLGVPAHGLPDFILQLENNPEALRVLASNTNETMRAQIEDWLVHPKHRSGGSAAPRREDITAYDREAFATTMKEEKEQDGGGTLTQEEVERMMADAEGKQAKEADESAAGAPEGVVTP